MTINTHHQKHRKLIMSKGNLRGAGVPEYTSHHNPKNINNSLKIAMNIDNNDSNNDYLKLNLTDPRGYASLDASQLAKKINHQMENHRGFFFK